MLIIQLTRLRNRVCCNGFRAKKSERSRKSTNYETLKGNNSAHEENVELWSAGLEASSFVQKLQVDIQPDDSVSQVGSKVSSSTPSKTSHFYLIEWKIQASPKKSVLAAESATLAKLQEIEEELKTKKRKARLQSDVELDKMKAKENALFEAEKQDSDIETKNETKQDIKTERTLQQIQLRAEAEHKPFDNVNLLAALERSNTDGHIQVLIRQQEAISDLTLPQPELQSFYLIVRKHCHRGRSFFIFAKHFE